MVQISGTSSEHYFNAPMQYTLYCDLKNDILQMKNCDIFAQNGNPEDRFLTTGLKLHGCDSMMVMFSYSP